MNHFAESIWVNGRIRTMLDDRPWASSLAVSDGRILGLGIDGSDLADLRGPNTEIFDLEGKFVMPGLIDSHVHALWGAVRDLFECFVGYQATLDEISDMLLARAVNAPKDQWLIGGPWRQEHLAQLSDELQETPCQFLDRLVPEHPVLFSDVTKHSGWANSAALRLAGIGPDTPDPPLGTIVRDHQGNPTGLLHESAMGLVRILNPLTDQDRKRAIQYMVNNFHSYGITAFKEPMAFEKELDAYSRADKSNRLKLHVFSHIARSSPVSNDILQIEDVLRLQQQYRTERHHPDGCKLFLDGVAPSRTAAFIDPYIPCCCVNYDPAKHDPEALLRITPKALEKQITEMDEAGLTVKMHAVGDRAVQAALDGISATRVTNGHSGIRHEVAHTTFVRKADMPRFRELDAIAEVSPKLWFPNPVTSVQIDVLGQERVHRCHPIKTLLDAGAEITYGSDWPAAAPDANPWIGLAGMLTRRHPHGTYDGSVGPDQKISLDEALPLFTSNGARALRLENDIGTLAKGKSADFIVLDRNLYEISQDEIASTQVLQTVFEGETVHKI
ncbi:MAG: amidohydrolase [Arenicellales bacterium]